MLDALRRLVARATDPAPAPGAPDGLQVAAAAILLELAHADGEFSADERAHVESALAGHFGLDAATAAELVALADAERRSAVDHFQFTRLVRERYDEPRRMALAAAMWRVVLADGTVADHEGYLMRKLGSLLDLDGRALADARRAAAG